VSSEERPDRNEDEQPVVRDRRRIDPETGLARSKSADGSDNSAAGETPVSNGGTANGDDELALARIEAAERLEDLRRLQAEYVNYRRRVERDREAVRGAAKADVLASLLDVLDDIGRARDHGDLNGGFRSVAEALESALSKAGLERYGEPGEAFDPTIHEALMHSYSDEVTEVTCVQILQPGYRVGERVLRAARVAVAEPTESLPEEEKNGVIGNNSDMAPESDDAEDAVDKDQTTD
jgi:molecular chaperone GrpE